MERKVAQTELDSEEYSALATAAKKSNLSIKEALRQAALQWVQEKSGINPDDPIFHLKPVVFRDKKGRVDKRASVDIDKIVYDEELSRDR
jgi:hypothetical protein